MSGDVTERLPIRVLPPELADQIAAGEVVERPASVVKELVENALDAGARRISVAIVEGGRRLIRVVDDGAGIPAAELPLAFLRHATSKLQSAQALFELDTLGFRGEALPSIAAVSRTSMWSRPAGALAGATVAVEGGRAGPTEEAGTPEGTRIEVRDLFFNTPARLKFLKGASTETSHVVESVLRLALAHPDIHVRLEIDGREALDLLPVRERGERVRSALGRRLGAELRSLGPGLSGGARTHEGATGESALLGALHVEAYLAPAAESRTTSRGLHLFVNGRPVRDRGLLYAVTAAHGETLERGRFPIGAVFVEMDRRQVDINVHPQKAEVRFAQPADVQAAVRRTLRAALGQPAPGSLPAYQRQPLAASAAASAEQHELALALPAASAAALGVTLAASEASQAYPLPAGPGTGAGMREPPCGRLVDSRAADELLAPGLAPARGPGLAPVPPSSAERATYLGQVGRLYLVFHDADGLFLLDQHAAHERVVFERLCAGHRERSLPVQKLLVPELCELSATESALAPEVVPLLAELGLEIEPMGERSWALRSVPVACARVDASRLLRDLIEEIGGDGGAPLASERMAARRLAVLARMACHGSVRAGDPLSPDEARSLAATLERTPRQDACPHGRPTTLRITLGELGRRFGRL